MSRISDKFAELAPSNEGAIIPYIMAGYPDQDATVEIVDGLVSGGADIIELGFPFSDPLADGAAIQNAGTVSLRAGTDTGSFFETVKRIRARTDVPLVLMTYTNILYRFGYHKFAAMASSAGIDGLILPDMSIEESAEYVGAARANGLDTTFLVSPNTDSARIRSIAGLSSGFLYLVAVYGTTGARTGIRQYTIKAIRNVRNITGGRIPIGVGFGVSSGRDVRRYMSAGADAVIVGSALVRVIGEAPRNMIASRVASFTKSLKKETVR